MNDNVPLVLILADQLRPDFIDRRWMPRTFSMMSCGVNFTSCYCASPLCVPSRGAIYTGRYPGDTGSLINGWHEPDRSFSRVRTGVPSLYTLLESSHEVWHAGKQHLFTEDRIDQASPGTPGHRIRWMDYETNYPAMLRERGLARPGGLAYQTLTPELTGAGQTVVKPYSTPHTGPYPHGLHAFFDGFIRQQCQEAINQRDRNRPLALCANFLAPHPPLHIPEPYFSMFGSDEVEPAQNVGRWGEGQSPLSLLHLPGFIGGRYERDDWREVWRVYAGLVRLLDDCVGDVLDALRDEGLYDDALIIFTTDHGEMLGSHRLWQKNCCYEESVRCPMIIKTPASEPITTGRRQSLVSHLDLLPTIIDYLGASPTKELAGRSLRENIVAGGKLEAQPVFVRYDGNGAIGHRSRCVIADHDARRWKLNLDFYSDQSFIELYDLQADPDEMFNQTKAEPKLVRELLRMLEVHLDAHSEADPGGRDLIRGVAA